MSEKLRNNTENGAENNVQTDWDMLSEEMISESADFEAVRNFGEAEKAKLARLQGMVRDMREFHELSAEAAGEAGAPEEPGADEVITDEFLDEEMGVDEGESVEGESDERLAEEEPVGEPVEKRERLVVRPEEIGTTAEEWLKGTKNEQGDYVGAQTGIMIDQGVKDGDSPFWVSSADRDGKPFETTLNRELEKYREQIASAKSLSDLSRATRIRQNVEYATGGDKAIMAQFDKLAEEEGYMDKLDQFKDDPLKYDRKQTSYAIVETSRQIDKAREAIDKSTEGLSQYKGLNFFKGLFGLEGMKRRQLKKQKRDAEKRLKSLQGDLGSLIERIEGTDRELEKIRQEKASKEQASQEQEATGQGQEEAMGPRLVVDNSGDTEELDRAA